MVDLPRITRLLHRISDEVAHLRRLAVRDDADITDDTDALPAAKYRLVVAIEAAIDIADHVVASEGLRPSTSFADSFRSLAEAGLLESGLARALEDAAKLRNLLVHQYADVDDTRVVEIIRTRLADLDEFVIAISRSLDGRSN